MSSTICGCVASGGDESDEPLLDVQVDIDEDVVVGVAVVAVIVVGVFCTDAFTDEHGKVTLVSALSEHFFSSL